MIVIMSNRNRLKIQVSGISELNIEWKNSRCGAVPTIYLFGCGSHTHTRPINFNMISYTVNWRLYFFATLVIWRCHSEWSQAGLPTQMIQFHWSLKNCLTLASVFDDGFAPLSGFGCARRVPSIIKDSTSPEL